MRNKVQYGHTVSKIHRLTKYYKGKSVIEKDWKYTPDKAALLVR
jgi:ribosomal protein S15P/S13E